MTRPAMISVSTPPARHPWLDVMVLSAVLACFLTGLTARAQESPSQPVAPPANLGTRRALIVCGLPGDSDHRKLFAETIEKLASALTGRYGFAASEVLVRFGTESKPGDGPAVAKARGLSTREGIAADVDELKKRLGPGRHALGDRGGAYSLRQPAFPLEPSRT